MARIDDSSDEDDDAALRWAGDEEQGRAAPRLGGMTTAAAPIDDEAEEPVAPGQRGRAAATAGFVVPYLAYTVLWVLVVQRLASGASELASEILWQFGEFLAMLAAPAWFAATLALTRGSRPLVRVGWLALGLGMLIPWPFVLDLYAALVIAGNLS